MKNHFNLLIGLYPEKISRKDPKAIADDPTTTDHNLRERIRTRSKLNSRCHQEDADLADFRLWDVKDLLGE